MRGLTMWQPWAQGVALGLKGIETRSWYTSYRGPLLIHAARRWTRAEIGDQARLVHAARAARGADDPAVLAFECRPPLGCVVALATLDDCLGTGTLHRLGLDPPERAFGDFGPGRFGWCLDDVRALPEPIPWPGAQGLWLVPPDLEARVLEALARRVPTRKEIDAACEAMVREFFRGPPAPAAQGRLFDPGGGDGPYGRGSP